MLRPLRECRASSAEWLTTSADNNREYRLWQILTSNSQTLWTFIQGGGGGGPLEWKLSLSDGTSKWDKKGGKKNKSSNVDDSLELLLSWQLHSLVQFYCSAKPKGNPRTPTGRVFSYTGGSDDSGGRHRHSFYSPPCPFVSANACDHQVLHVYLLWAAIFQFAQPDFRGSECYNQSTSKLNRPANTDASLDHHRYYPLNFSANQLSTADSICRSWETWVHVCSTRRTNLPPQNMVFRREKKIRKLRSSKANFIIKCVTTCPPSIKRHE